jgi:RND family efflux transporter MFP subunit
MKKIILPLLAASIALIMSCSKSGDDQKKPGQGMLTENPPQSVKVETVQPKDLQLYAEITGKLEGITDIVYYSEVSGKVQNIEKKLGEMILKGEAIAELESRNYQISYDQAKSELKSSEANLSALKIKLETTRKLFESGKVSKYELTNDESALTKAEAAVEGARAGVERARLNYENSKFLSPVDGSIAQLNIKEGQFVAAGQPVASIIDCSKLIIKTGVTENDIVSMRNGSTVEIRHNGEEKVVYGKVTGFGKRPDATGNYPVEILIENKNRDLLPGMIVRGKIESTRLNGLIYTDFDNIVEEFGKYYVYIISTDNKAEKRQVNIGKKYGNTIVIESGLKHGEKFVASGVDAMTNGVEVRIFGQQHKNEK